MKPPPPPQMANRSKRKAATSRAVEPLSLSSSDIVATRVRPAATELHTSKNLMRLKEKLSHLNRADLLKLLRLVQDRIDHSIKRRQVELAGSETALVNNSGQTHSTVNGTTKANINTKLAPSEPVVVRSQKLKQLMSHMDKIELIMPQINKEALDRLAATTDEEEKSVVRVIKPGLLSSILQANSSEMKPQQHVVPSIDKLAADAPPSFLWREPMEAVAPDADWPQDQQAEDWPTVTSSTTQRPRKRKRKRLRTTTSTTTTTTTTTTTPVPEAPTGSSTAPPAAFEEVWIEEEEDIVRPPRRKTKKYKKKTSPEPRTTTTTTSTTTTTTTTTRAPTTTSTSTSTQSPAVIIEDWPEEEWPQQEVSTKAPSIKWWPEKSQPLPEEEHQKWPEEEWLNALRDDIQSRLHVVYA